MKSIFSKSWLRSKQPRKQRKYVYNAPLHIQHKLMSAHLCEELRKKYKRRSFPIRKGDKVKVLRGQFKGTIGEIEEVNLKKRRVYVKGVEIKRKEGRAIRRPLTPSNLLILNLKLEDTKRKQALLRGQENTINLSVKEREDFKEND